MKLKSFLWVEAEELVDLKLESRREIESYIPKVTVKGEDELIHVELIVRDFHKNFKKRPSNLGPKFLSPTQSDIPEGSFKRGKRQMPSDVLEKVKICIFLENYLSDGVDL